VLRIAHERQSRRRRHHPKPGPRLDPTRLRDEGGNILIYSAARRRGRSRRSRSNWRSQLSGSSELNPLMTMATAVIKCRGRRLADDTNQPILVLIPAGQCSRSITCSDEPQ
jgi:hypothetical protein